MKGHANLGRDPWVLREKELDLEHLGQTESVFALSNGHIGLRGNFDEGEPNVVPGTYVSGVFEHHPLPYPEGGYGYPEAGQAIVNVTNGKLIRLLVDDEPFDVRYGKLTKHERRLDMRTGILRREVHWTSPAGRPVKIKSSRLVSFPHRAVAAIAYTIEAVEETRIIVQSGLVANEPGPVPAEGDDPRVARALHSPLVPVSQDVEQCGAVLVHRTAQSELQLAAGMDHDIECDAQYDLENEVRDDWARTSVVTLLQPGQKLRVVKYVAYGWSGTRSSTALRDQVAAALTSARYAGWSTLRRLQREYLADYWAAADIEIEGDPVLQQAVRFGLFHVLQAGARSEGRAIGAKGLTGTGYNGHTFWDIEGFVLPVLTLTAPEAAAYALRWRAGTLQAARDRARTLGLGGASFPWRTIDGAETSAYWPAGTAAFHINADIVRAFEVYRQVTGDTSLEREGGVAVLVETARLWHSRGHHDSHGGWHIDGVTGPDEYTAVVDDNVFTNLQAARNLTSAAEACRRNPDLAEGLGVTTAELAAWEKAARNVHIPYDETLGVHEQCSHFTRFAEWEFEPNGDRYPLLLHAPYVQLYRKQVVKQADLVLAMHWHPEAFTAGEKARNLDYYERRTVRDSSLSACTQAVVCAEVGHIDLARDYLHEAALVDLHDLQQTTEHGVHLASLAGAWIGVVAGFGGLREDGEVLRLAPALPSTVQGLTFRVRWHGMRLEVRIGEGQVRCAVAGTAGCRMPLRLYDEDVEVRDDAPLVRPLRPPKPLLPQPTQPPGRAPRRINGEGGFEVPRALEADHVA